MGVTVDAQFNDNNEYVQNVKGICRISIERAFSIFKYSDLTFRLYPDYRNAVKALNHLHSVTDSVIRSRSLMMKNEQENAKEGKDDIGVKRKLAFLDILLNSTVDGQPLSPLDIREEVDTFMFEVIIFTTAKVYHITFFTFIGMKVRLYFLVLS